MKIWFPMPTTKTGSEVFTRRLVSGLERIGIETAVTVYPAWAEAMPMSFYSSRLKPPAGTSIIHLNANSAAGFSRFGMPIVITAHGASERADYDNLKSIAQRVYHAFIMRPAIKRAVRDASAVTAVSEWVADVCKQDYSCSKIYVISNWVDSSFFSTSEKTIARKVLFVGRSTWQKGGHLLSAIAGQLGKDIEFTCTLEQSEWQGPIPDNVRLIGAVKSELMPELYRSHDTLIVPSVAEGFCLAAAEAMAGGLPVFGFRGHGLADVLGKIGEHTLAEMNDVEGLTVKIRTVLDDLTLYKKISQQGLERIEKNFTEALAVSKYLELYKSISGPHGTGKLS